MFTYLVFQRLFDQYFYPIKFILLKNQKHLVGIKELERIGNFTCYILHDVDMLPVATHIPYNCSQEGPLHMSTAIDKFDWRFYLFLFSHNL